MSISYTQSVNESRKGSALSDSESVGDDEGAYSVSIFCPFTSRDPSEEGFTALPPNVTFL